MTFCCRKSAVVPGFLAALVFNSIFIFPVEAGSFLSVASMTTARTEHTATLLQNGQVLVAGGQGDFGVLSSAELWNPATSNWIAVGSLSNARYSHTATLLSSGKVLVTGGEGPTAGQFLSSSELYDPTAGKWSTTGALNTARVAFTATLLNNGKVLVAGGLGYSNALSSAELYDPTAGTWSSAGSLTNARYAHTATLLTNGKVLVTGGTGGGVPLASAEIYDPVAGTWSAANSMNTGRVAHTASLLPDGTVLVTSGYNNTALASAEIYNPAANTWTTTNPLNLPRDSHTATLLRNGQVVIIGGTYPNQGGNVPVAGTEVYNSTNASWTTNVNLKTARFNHTSTLLPGGQILVAGGEDNSGGLASAEEYMDLAPPVFQTVSSAGGKFTFRWSAVNGSSYQVQYKTNLASGSWENLGSSITATNSVMSATDSIVPGASSRFYRIALLQ